MAFNWDKLLEEAGSGTTAANPAPATTSKPAATSDFWGRLLNETYENKTDTFAPAPKPVAPATPAPSTAPVVTTPSAPAAEEKGNLFERLTGNLFGKSAQLQAANAMQSVAALTKNEAARNAMTPAAQKQQTEAMERLEGPSFGNYLARKAVGGGADTIEGVANFGGYWYQDMVKSGELQHNNALRAAAATAKDPETKAAMEKYLQEQGINEQQAADITQRDSKTLTNFADNYMAETEEKFADSDFGLIGKALGDVSQGAGGMAVRMPARFVPGLGEVITFASAYGNAKQNALKSGAIESEASTYALGSAAVELITEKVFGFVGGIGNGFLDKWVTKQIGKAAAKFANSAAAETALNVIAGAAGEGFEEWIAEIAQGYIDKITIKTDERNFGEMFWDGVYNGIVGSLTGLLFGVSSAISNNGGKLPAYKEIDELTTQAAAQTNAEIAQQSEAQTAENSTAAEAPNLPSEDLQTQTSTNLSESETRVLEALTAQGISSGKALEMLPVITRIISGDTTLSNNALASIGLADKRVKAVVSELTGTAIDPAETGLGVLKQQYRAAIEAVAQRNAAAVEVTETGNEAINANYKVLTAEEKNALSELAATSDWGDFRDSILLAREEYLPGTSDPLLKAIGKLMDSDGNIGIGDLFNAASNNFVPDLEVQQGVDTPATETAAEGEISPLDKTETAEYSKNEQSTAEEVAYGTEESTYNRGWQDPGRADNQPHREGSGESSESRGWNGRGDLGSTERAVIPEQTRKIMTDKGMPDVELSETTDRGAFSVALESAKAANPKGGMVDPQSPENLQKNGSRTFMRVDGNAGVAVEADGNIVGVFKNPRYKERGAVYDLILTAIANGGNHLDCYSTYTPADLRTKYARMGFIPVCYLEFSDEAVDANWNYEAWGRPDVVMWVHNGDTVEQIIERSESYHVPTRDEIHALPKFEGADGYEKAQAYQMAEVERRSQKTQRNARMADIMKGVMGQRGGNIPPRKVIINKLTGEELSENTYAVMDRLNKGENVAQEEISNLKEVLEGKVRADELTEQFAADHPELSDVPLEDMNTTMLNDDERVQLRSDIISERLNEGSFTGLDKNGDEIYDGAVERGKRIDIVIGLPAAGKSSALVNPLSQYYKSLVVDSDIIKKKLPEYADGLGASLVHEESSLMNVQLLKAALKQGDNVVLPIVGSKLSGVEKYIALAEERGYNVNIHLNELPSSKAIGRMLNRYFEDGRFIDPSYAVKYGNKPTEVYEQIKQRSGINGYSRWNNDVERGTRPALIEDSESNRAFSAFSGTWRAARNADAGGSNSRGKGGKAETNQITPTEAPSGDGVFFNGKTNEPTLTEEQRRITKRDELMNRTVKSMMGYEKPAKTDDGLGAADADFAGETIDYQDWVEQGGPVQTVSEEQAQNLMEQRGAEAEHIPVKNAEGRLTNRQAQTLINSGITTDSMAESIKSALANGAFSRMAYRDKAAIDKAEHTIKRVGWENALGSYESDVNSGRISKDITAMGIALYNNAVANGDNYTAMDIASLMISNSSTAAQALQASRMLNKLTPDGRVYMAARSVENLQEELVARYGENAPELEVDEGLLNDYREALISGDEAAIRQTWNAVEQNIADQIPATWYEKLNTWRYLSMLGNPRTHIRNIVGNAGFAPVRLIKQMVGTGLERAVIGKAGQGSERTKAILNPFSASDRGLIQAAWLDFDDVQDAVLSGGKYNDSQGSIQDKRTIYKTKPLEAVRKANSRALDVEDKVFSRAAYAEALASYMKAQGIDSVDYLNGNLTEEARLQAQEYAIKEAQKATYRDINQFSEFVSRLGRVGKNANSSKVSKAAGVFVEGMLPFKKTPANILVRAVEYSPLEFGTVLFNDIKAVKKGDMSTAEMLDHIASGLTGTGIVALGGLLRALGVVSGGADEDEKQAAFNELRGQQEYAITIGDKNYTLDWLAPEALPLFMGVELYDAFADKEGEGSAFTRFINALPNIAEPMLNMSMLSSVNDLISNVSYIDEGSQLWSIIAQSGISYLQQYLPTLFGQIERITESERETTFVDRNSNLGSDAQYNIGKSLNKLPGEYAQIPYIDAWGRTESSGNVGERIFNNMFNPAYVGEDTSTPNDDELQRLYDLGYTDVLPTRASQSTKIDGQYLTAEEYLAYATIRGSKSLEYVTTLMEGAAYANLSDSAKAKAVAEVYALAKEEAEAVVHTMRGERKGKLDPDLQTAIDAGMNVGTYFTVQGAIKTANVPAGYTNQPAWHKDEIIMGMDISDEDKLTAIKLVHSDSSVADKIQTAYDNRISLEHIVAYYSICQMKGSDGKKLDANERAAEARRRGISDSEFEKLEDIF